MTINVGRMPYLNSELFYLAMNGGPFALHPLVPTAMARAAQEGLVDAGPIPLLDCIALEERFERLGGFCIATRERARSILLFSRLPIEALDGRAVGVTDETSTSARLLKVLLHHRFHVRPSRYGELMEESDAVLLIGDSALKARRGMDSRPYTYDLGQEWHRWTGLPFVFALWIVRRDMPEEGKVLLRKTLARSLEVGLADIEAAANRRPDLAMTPAEVREYLEGFDFTLGPGEEQAVKEFTRLLDLLPKEERHAEHH